MSLLIKYFIAIFQDCKKKYNLKMKFWFLSRLIKTIP